MKIFNLNDLCVYICIIQNVYCKQILYLIYLSAVPMGFPQPTEEEFKARTDKIKMRAYNGVYGFYFFTKKIENNLGKI